MFLQGLAKEIIMRKRKIKRVGALALSLAMILGMMPGITKPITVQAANTAPDKFYWTDLDGLKTYNLSTDGTIGKIKFGLNGTASREWAICGVDTNAYNSLALLSTTDFGTAVYGNDRKYSTSKFVNDIKNYISNDNNNSTYLGNTYFSTSELDKMQPVTVSTNEPNGQGGNTATSVTEKKLYLPNSQDQISYGQNTIYVGSNNNISIDVTKLTSGNGFQTNYFWLRSPGTVGADHALVAVPGGRLGHTRVYNPAVSIVPALNMNLSSVIFASAANAASSTYIGDKANSTMTANTFTLRYASVGSETAVISPDGTSVAVNNANGKYLMVQNSAGVYAKLVDSSSETINASTVTINGSSLTDFNNCKVWLESTTDRITTAKMATQATVTDAEKVAAVKNAVITGLGTFTATNNTTEADIIGLVDAAKTSTGYTTVAGSFNTTFAKNNATTSATGSVSGTLTISCGAESDTIAVSKTIAKLNNDETQPAPNSPSHKDDVPKTGDTTPIAWLFILALISGTGILYFGRKKKTVK